MDYVWPEETDGLDVVVDRPSVGVAFSGLNFHIVLSEEKTFPFQYQN